MPVPLISALPTVPSYDNTNFESLAPAFLSFLKNTFQAEMNAAIAAINSYDYGAAVNISKVVGLTAGHIPYGAGTVALASSANFVFSGNRLDLTNPSGAQARLTHSSGNYTDFQTDGDGNLTIAPSGGRIRTADGSLWANEFGIWGGTYPSFAGMYHNFKRDLVDDTWVDVFKFSRTNVTESLTRAGIFHGTIKISAMRRNPANATLLQYTEIPFSVVGRSSSNMEGTINTALYDEIPTGFSGVTISVQFTAASPTEITLQIKTAISSPTSGWGNMLSAAITGHSIGFEYAGREINIEKL